LGCFTPVGEPDMELQRRMPGQIRGDACRRGPWSARVSLDLDFDSGREG
jgi:hypothetical protein